MISKCSKGVRLRNYSSKGACGARRREQEQKRSQRFMRTLENCGYAGEISFKGSTTDNYRKYFLQLDHSAHELSFWVRLEVHFVTPRERCAERLQIHQQVFLA